LKSLAAILTAVNQPLELREIEWQEPGFGQVLVRVISSGICGAQLQEIRGEKGEHFPRLMGHEGVGCAEEVGVGVTSVKPGNLVVCHWRKGAGCESPAPTWKMMADATWEFKPHTAGQVTTFSQYSVVSENRLTVVPEGTPYELSCLLGCSLSTALGTIEHEVKLLMGESVLIIGCGGLGLNLILAAKLRQAGRIVACDSEPSKYKVACDLGAEYFAVGVGSTYEQFDVVIDTSGNAEAIAEGISKLAPSGRMVMVGQPKPRENVMLTNARHMFDGSGKSIHATQGGRFSPSTDIKRYVDMWRAGRLNVEGIVTHRFPLSGINEALDLVRNGQAGRVLIDCNDQ